MTWLGDGPRVGREPRTVWMVRVGDGYVPHHAFSPLPWASQDRAEADRLAEAHGGTVVNADEWIAEERARRAGRHAA